MANDMMSVKEAAEKMKVSGQSVRNAINEGLLKAERVGNQWIISESELSAYILKNNVVIEPDDHQRLTSDIPKIVALSFFSGAMGLDLGMEAAGIKAVLTCEFEKNCRKTIHANRPDVALIGDICKYDAKSIRKMANIPEDCEIDVMFGGPPCQAFSTAGARRAFDDERGNVFLKYLELASQLKPKYLVIENVRGLLSTEYYYDPKDLESPKVKGGALKYILEKIRGMGYSATFNLYNAANYGAPQIRERVILLCKRNGEKMKYLTPTNSEHGEFNLPMWKTLGDALSGLDCKTHHFKEFPENRLRYYRILTEGQYWKDLPVDLQKEAMGRSYYLPGGKTGFYRRVAFDKPCPTLVTDPTMPATDLCHPTELRPLSVEEYRRIQGFPDDWVICGDIKNQYKQIGNAVPISLGKAIGDAIVSDMNGTNTDEYKNFRYSRYLHTTEYEWREYYFPDSGDVLVRNDHYGFDRVKKSQLASGQLTLDKIS